MPEPRVVPGLTHMVDTGCGHLYVTLCTNGPKPFRVRAELGKAGTCTKGLLEALSECISLGIRGGVPVEEFAKALKGIRCPAPNLYPKEEEVLSCADGVGKALEVCLKEMSEKEGKVP